MCFFHAINTFIAANLTPWIQPRGYKHVNDI